MIKTATKERNRSNLSVLRSPNVTTWQKRILWSKSYLDNFPGNISSREERRNDDRERISNEYKNERTIVDRGST